MLKFVIVVNNIIIISGVRDLEPYRDILFVPMSRVFICTWTIIYLIVRICGSLEYFVFC